MHRSIGHSPFRMLFGRDPRLPIDIMQKGEDLFLDADTAIDTKLISSSAEAHMQIMDTILEKSHSKASIKIVAAQATPKKYYDQRKKMPSHEVGCEVLLRNSREDSRKGSKLYDPWRGPYLIVDVSSKDMRTGLACNLQPTLRRSAIYASRKS